VQVSCAAEWFRGHLLYPGAGIVPHGEFHPEKAQMDFG
jgi:hypothetical protein